MSVEHAYLCLVIGIISGWFTAAIFGGGYTVVADLFIGVLGALLGGVAFHAFFGGIAGTMCGALVGAAVFLVALRFVHRVATR